MENNKEVQEINQLVCLIEKILNDETNNLTIKLPIDVKKYFLLLCQENPSVFGIIENDLKNIILDNKIDTKDIPELISLVSNMYSIIKYKKYSLNIDIYDLIKEMLNISFVVYIETNNIKNAKLLGDLLRIVDISIDLIRIQPFSNKKKSCFGCF
jgi:hypothetical protein